MRTLMEHIVVLEGNVDNRKRKGEEEMQRKGLAFQTSNNACINYFECV